MVVGVPVRRLRDSEDPAGSHQICLRFYESSYGEHSNLGWRSVKVMKSSASQTIQEQTAALEREEPASKISPFIVLTERVPLGHPRTACPKPLSDAKATPRNFILTKFIQLAWGLESRTWATTTLTHIAVSQKGDPHGP